MAHFNSNLKSRVVNERRQLVMFITADREFSSCVASSGMRICDAEAPGEGVVHVERHASIFGKAGNRTLQKLVHHVDGH